jgi:hypothetical protein
MRERRPGPHGGKAAVVWEETGMGTTRAAGGGGQARGDSCAERTSGRTTAQQGLAATCRDPRTAGQPKQGGGTWSGA